MRNHEHTGDFQNEVGNHLFHRAFVERVEVADSLTPPLLSHDRVQVLIGQKIPLQLKLLTLAVGFPYVRVRQARLVDNRHLVDESLNANARCCGAQDFHLFAVC
eukprot:EC793805.1.p2 GENE.EC793805.1~~EC793805.1.p2  ORF type:complete len:104 (-),score=9.23 EC793805.1:37-348(-)